MQDDLAWVALTQEIGGIIRKMAVTVMAQYGAEVSVEKRLEDEAVIDGPQPNPVVLFIGGLFATMDLGNLTRGAFMRAQEKTLERFEAKVEEWEQYPPGKLAPRELMQTTIGMAFFHGRFGVRVRRRINSGIRLLRGREGRLRGGQQGVEAGPGVNVGGVPAAARGCVGARPGVVAPGALGMQ